MDLPIFWKLGDYYAFALLTKNNLVLSFRLDNAPALEEFISLGERITYDDLPNDYKQNYDKMSKM